MADIVYISKWFDLGIRLNQNGNMCGCDSITWLKMYYVCTFESFVSTVRVIIFLHLANVHARVHITVHAVTIRTFRTLDYRFGTISTLFAFSPQRLVIHKPPTTPLRNRSSSHLTSNIWSTKEGDDEGCEEKRKRNNIEDRVEGERERERERAIERGKKSKRWL